MIRYIAAVAFISGIATPAASNHVELAQALGYADSASWDCDVPALNDDARRQALQGYWDTGDYATSDGVAEAYIGAFKAGQARHRAAMELGETTPEERCAYAQELLLKELD